MIPRPPEILIIPHFLTAQFHPTQGISILRRLLLTLPASKMDLIQWGITLTIAAVGDSACSVKALYHLTTTWPSKLHAPLFGNIAFDTFHANHNLTFFHRKWVVSQLRQLLVQEGILGHYSGHSFRRAAGIWAKQVGIPNEDIQLLGLWKSSAYKHCIEIHQEHIFNISRRLQTNTELPWARPTRSPPTEQWDTPTGGISVSSRQHVGVVGREGRVAGEPRPASGVVAP